MTKRKADIIRPDQRLAAQIETLAFLFDCSVSTLERAVAAGMIRASDKFGVKLFLVEDVKNALFCDDSESFEVSDPSVAAVHAKKKINDRKPSA